MRPSGINPGSGPVSFEELDEIEVVDPNMEFASILEIPLHYRIFNSLHNYSAKINASATAPAALSYIVFAISVVQWTLPAFIIDSQEIWPDTNFLTTVFNIFGVFWVGSPINKDITRLTLASLLSLVFLILIVTICVRAYIYQKSLKISVPEIWGVYITYTFVLPLFIPHFIIGIPIAIGNILNNTYVPMGAFTVLFVIITFSLWLYIHQGIISPRILPEESPWHEWESSTLLLSLGNIAAQSFLCVIPSFFTSKFKCVPTILMAIINALFAVYVFLYSGTLKRIPILVVSSCCGASAIVALLQTINLLVDKHISPEIVLVIGILSFIVIILLLYFLNTKLVTSILEFYDGCYESPEKATELMKEQFKSPQSFLRKTRLAIEQWHPFFTTMETFIFALEEWPNNEKILLQYTRILSFFPLKNNQMIWISSLISKLRTKKCYTTHLLQLRHLSRTRQTALSPAIKKQIDFIHSTCESLKIILRRFWENILQKNTSNFWDDIAKVNERTNDVEASLKQMLDDYPNNEAVLLEYIDFVANIKYDFLEESELRRKLYFLRRDGRTKQDLALTVVTKVFPLFNDFQETIDQQQTAPIELEDNNMNENSDDNENKNRSRKRMMKRKSKFNIHKVNANDDDDEEEDCNLTGEDSSMSANSNIESAIQHLTSKSRLGRVWHLIVVLMITTGICIGLYFLYNKSYHKGFVTRETKAIEFLQALGQIIFEINQMAFYMTSYPMFYAGYPATIPANIMEIVGPNLYPAKRISKIIINSSMIAEKVGSAGDAVSSAFKTLSELDSKDQSIINLANKFQNVILLDKYGLNTKDTIMQLVLDCRVLLLKPDPQMYLNSPEYSRCEELYLSLSGMLRSMSSDALEYATKSFDDNTKLLNEKMVLVCMLTLLLVTLPYVLFIFLLMIQSTSIAESFSYFPNTEIRSIINKFGSSTSKNDEEATAVAQLSQMTSNKNMETLKMGFTFVLSFFPMIGCCLCTYFMSGNFVSRAKGTADKIFFLYPAFGLMLAGAGFAMRVFQIDVNSTYYQSIFEQREMAQMMTKILVYDSVLSFSQGMWGETAGAMAFYEDKTIDIDYFTDIFPKDNEHVSKVMSPFERFATGDLLISLDVILAEILSMITYHENITYSDADNELVYSILYYFGQFAPDKRNMVYFQTVERLVKKEIGHFSSDQDIIFGTGIAFQVISLICCIMYLVDRHNSIRTSLRFYHFVDPQVLLHSQNALQLIENGQKTTEKVAQKFSNANDIINKFGQGVVILDSNFIIIDNNSAFLNIVQKKDVKGMNLNDLIQKDEEDNSWSEFINLLRDTINNQYLPKFTQNITAHLQDGQTVHFSCSVIAMSSKGAVEEGENVEIEKVAVILEDCTQFFMRQQIIEQEQSLAKQILGQVMPERMVRLYLNSQENSEGISFVIQSITIGQIEVRPLKKFERNSEEPFKFYNEVFEFFDEEMKEFDLLCKARTFGNSYCFVGGLFSDVNKPEKHAEQAVRFTLKMLSCAETLSVRLGCELDMKSGIHTGGPVVAGVMENQRPALQIIGTVMELAAQMTETGIPKQIQISRAVYELIFSAGFHVIERGDISIRDGIKITTYLVYPK